MGRGPAWGNCSSAWNRVTGPNVLKAHCGHESWMEQMPLLPFVSTFLEGDVASSLKNGMMSQHLKRKEFQTFSISKHLGVFLCFFKCRFPINMTKSFYHPPATLSLRFSSFVHPLEECHYRRGDRWLTLAEVSKAGSIQAFLRSLEPGLVASPGKRGEQQGWVQRQRHQGLSNF